ncbi:MAG: AAA family ATPase, partial [Sedimentisphaerales bacterium]|nr:AAA family ATPase [Sedimentisphaerales bacterium]
MTQEYALSILKTGESAFVTGEPGSGKTYIINEFISWLRERGVEPAITASTGIAATHIGGLTIHSWSGIGIKEKLTRYDLQKISENRRAVKRVRETHTLIIDEISMLSAGTLEMVESVCRAIRGGAEPFGGLQVVLVGDFFQLPPIIRRAIPGDIQEEFFPSENSSSIFAFDSPAWRRLNPAVCYLSEQHRQGDGEFLDILSAIRGSSVEEKHRASLRTRIAQSFSGEATK